MESGGSDNPPESGGVDGPPESGGFYADVIMLQSTLLNKWMKPVS